MCRLQECLSRDGPRQDISSGYQQSVTWETNECLDSIIRDDPNKLLG